MSTSANNIPLVTVRIASYNHGQWIKQAILSVINQSYGNVQLIVIDDCSQDDSDRIIRELYDQYGFNYIHHTENKGVVYTMNEFTELAEGKYIAGCASDDYWELDKLAVQVKFMNEHPEYAMSTGLARKLDEMGNELGIVPSPNKRAYSGWLCDAILTKKIDIIAPTCMTKLAVLKEVGGYDSKYRIEDTPLWLKIASKYEIGYINQVLVNRRYHKNSIHKNSDMLLDMWQKLIEEYKHRPTYKESLFVTNLEHSINIPGFIPKMKQYFSSYRYFSLKKDFVKYAFSLTRRLLRSLKKDLFNNKK